jgi:hypothetical protein
LYDYLVNSIKGLERHSKEDILEMADQTETCVLKCGSVLYDYGDRINRAFIVYEGVIEQVAQGVVIPYTQDTMYSIDLLESPISSSEYKFVVKSPSCTLLMVNCDRLISVLDVDRCSQGIHPREDRGAARQSGQDSSVQQC